MDLITTAAARARGIDKDELTRLVDTGEIHRLALGAYYAGDHPHALAVRAQIIAAVSGPTAIICRRTAAWLWGLDVLPPGKTSHDWPVELLVAAGERTRPRRPGCRGHEAEITSADITLLGGVAITTQERTALDCARFLPRLEAVAALDQFLRRRVEIESLQTRALALAGRRNAKRLREVLQLGDAGAQAPSESWTRVLIVDAGLPRPETQIHVILPSGAEVFVDMGYPNQLVGVEYDGEKYHSSAEDLAHDAWRRAQLRECGWELVIVRKSDVLGRPADYLEDLTGKLLSRGWRPSTEQMTFVLTRLRMLRNREARFRLYAA
ncbi:type IV toxin-antitoxin system AbiEi family antitoxin domain-containing protein [Planotetraspora kaengkrachanensis]|uniref:Restriction endonuclease type II-like domain-containing protein n=1 Tax=Planotetraspora kaengkrachanensis TaxID=575193 RepID=A0A8J3Q0U6_9ACTN|nr:type IV toxin-antitoxin system AbiEi family antitoxin domain-containing protein [Planotetraspora kaengkrachanensis]GIG84766.1 hypothetical protein Pka01_78930 [Planotetraspora kaengkrachanensis]